MRGITETSSLERKRWQQVILGFASIFVIAVAEGAYLIMIVSYLERSRVPVNQIGAVMAFLSVLEAITTLGAGFVLRRWPLLVTLTLPLLAQAASAAILIFQPLGWAVWASAGLNGLGMGLVGVALYTTTLDRRPAGLRLGTTIGWYTGFIAAGNGVGALLSGLLADKWGFPAAFVLSTACFLLATVLSVILQVLPAVPAPEPEPIRQSDESGRLTVPAWAWLAATLAAFSLAGINTAFEILFPVYGLRAGLSVAVIGSLEGLKALLAGVIRPFSGMALARVRLMPVNTASLIGLAASVALVPWVGLQAGLAALMAAFGLGFGTSRVVSATLLLADGPRQALSGRRISYYSTALCIGAIIGPWIAGMLALRLGVSAAFVLTPVLFVGLFLAALALLPRLGVRSPDLLKGFPHA
jgi:DHA1 family multidrug resistance protein-like MFS transporter